jgi:hypothetical protein
MIARARAAEKRHAISDKQYAAWLKELEHAGIYQPIGEELTPYRKRAIVTRRRQFAEFLDREHFQFVELPAAERGRELAAGRRTTRRGVFVERRAGERITKRRSKTFKGYYEIRRGHIALRGESKGKVIYDIEPLVPPEVIAAEEAKLRRAAEALGPLKKNERIGFVLETKGTPGKGYSRKTFTSIRALMNYIKRYQRKDYAQILASITIRKTTLVAWEKEAKPHRPPERPARTRKRRRRRPFRH